MMTDACELVTQNYLEHLKGQFRCQPIEENLIEIVTPYFYPDRNYISVYIEQLADGRIRVSDFGEAINKLTTYGFSLSRKSRAKEIIEDLVKSNDVVKFRDGSFYVVANPEFIGPRVDELFGVIRQISDLIYTFRGYSLSTFKDEVAELLKENDFVFEQNHILVGQSGHEYKPDFYLNSSRSVAVQALSANNKSYADILKNDTYYMFSDLRLANQRLRTVAILDDEETNIWSQVDFSLFQLPQLNAPVLFWSKQDQLVQTLKIL